MKTTHALTKVRRFFPQVNKVVDADEPIFIQVNKADNKASRKKDPANCAFAHACKRQGLADGAIINIGISYLIKGDVATRYRTPATVGREITSFDRHQDFATGKDYRLSAISESFKLNKKKRYKKSNGPTPRKAPEIVHKHHRTTRIRISKA